VTFVNRYGITLAADMYSPKKAYEKLPAIDTRIKATLACTMYDMSRVNANGYFDSEKSADARYEKKVAINTARTEGYRADEYTRAGGCLSLPDDESLPFFVKDYSSYYKGSLHKYIYSKYVFESGL